jgi:hypothetical protein
VVGPLFAVSNVDNVKEGLVDAEGIDPDAEMLWRLDDAATGEFVCQAHEIDINISHHIISATILEYGCGGNIVLDFVVEQRRGHGAAIFAGLDEFVVEENAVTVDKGKNERFGILMGQHAVRS